MALGGISLTQLLQAEAQAGISRSHKAVIMVFLAGGPPHLDMFDMKPNAPSGIRGEYKPISTNVPGLDICEYMPRLAKMMDRFTLIRSLVGAADDHSAGQCLTGYRDRISKARAGVPVWAPSSHLQGPVHPDVPPFVGLSPKTGEPRWAIRAILATSVLSHAPFTPFRTEAKLTRRNRLRDDSGGLSLDEKVIVPERLLGRRSLLGELDAFRRTLTTMKPYRGWRALPSAPSRSLPRVGSLMRST